MIPQGSLASAAALLTAFAIAAVLVLVQEIRREHRLRRRLLNVQGSARSAQQTPARFSLLSFVAAVGNSAFSRIIFSARTRAEIQDMFASLGLRHGRVLELFIGTKLLLFITGPAVTYLVTGLLAVSHPLDQLAMAGTAMAGLILPETLVQRLRKRHLDAVERGLGDMIDLLVMCAQAGLGLEPGLQRVTREIAYSHPALSRELDQTVDELRLSVDRRAALLNFANRTQRESIRRVTGTIIQTIQYGTPLTESLRNLGVEMRELTLARYEERAARLPVLLTVPMIVFIFPCIFIVMAGPAVMHLTQAFSR